MPQWDRQKSMTTPDFKSNTLAPTGLKVWAEGTPRSNIDLQGTMQHPLTSHTSKPSLHWWAKQQRHLCSSRQCFWIYRAHTGAMRPCPPNTLLPHQPVLLEATDSVCDTRRWGNGASRPGMRLSTATSGFPFQMRKIPEQRRSQRLVCKTQHK